MVQEEYYRALGLEYVRNPLAWAFYQVWRKLDSKNERGAENGA